MKVMCFPSFYLSFSGSIGELRSSVSRRKKQCSNLTAETLDHTGRTYGGHPHPTPFLCLSRSRCCRSTTRTSLLSSLRTTSTVDRPRGEMGLAHAVICLIIDTTNPKKSRCESHEVNEVGRITRQSLLGAMDRGAGQSLPPQSLELVLKLNRRCFLQRHYLLQLYKV